MHQQQPNLEDFWVPHPAVHVVNVRKFTVKNWIMWIFQGWCGKFMNKRWAQKKCSASTVWTQWLNIETETGSRFTELMNLSYYDCIRYTIIDPMHNLLLGTPKCLFTKQWVNSGLLTKSALEDIRDVVSRRITPSGVGCIPHKPSANFSKLTTDEWKNWTLLFSPKALHNHFPPEDYTRWPFYVPACNTDSTGADELIKSFFITAEALYGASFLSINTHLH